MSSEVEQDAPQMEGVAIVGMACRFPGASTPEAFWKNLQEGVESITFLKDEELDRAAIDPAELKDPKYVKARATLDGIDQFDARFFELSPREAEITDPQQRLFMECVWEALETAGHDPSRAKGPIGIYAGAGANGYLLYNLSSAGHLTGTVSAFQAVIHNKNDHLATRVAYKLDLKGPAVTVQTACSTSLVAVYHACQSLLNFQCDMALAGGVTITVPQKTGYLYTERGIGSPDGHCRPFDANAQGTVGGSGAGAVVLKRLSDAIADGDIIHAVIRGGALNNDGTDKVGYTAPSVNGQAEVIGMAHALSGVDPDTITYVEAHGTGTPMGDPIEVKALTKAFRSGGATRNGYCGLGSVKSNVGHLDTAAGIAGLIKTALTLKHRQLPPSLGFEKPNPEIDFAGSPFYVNAKLQDWNAPSPRRAGVSAFGLGGTNAHVVLEEAPQRAPSGPSREHQLLVVSARSDAALETATTRLAEHLKAHPDLNLADVAFTLQKGRKAFEHRRFVVVRTVEEAAQALATLSPDRVITRTQERVTRPVMFMFPGQGSQHPGMAASLYRGEAVFRQEADRCLELLSKRHGLELKALLFETDTQDAQAAAKLEQTALTQPALFVVEYALAKLLLSWGLEPAAMIGHSVGEYVAACLAGVFTLEDALELVATRGRLMQSCPPGAMLSVQLAEADVRPYLSEGLEVAAANAPGSCVVAGPPAAIEALEKRLAAKDVLARRLRTSHAFHSAMMDPIVGAFRDAVAKAKPSAPKLRFISNVTGTWITAEQATSPDYWAKHLRQPVRFADGLDELLKESEAVLLEVGPGKALQSLARWHPRKKPTQSMHTLLPTVGEATPEAEYLLRTLGHLWLLGVDAPGYFDGETRRREPLPTYPFERQRYWVDLRSSTSAQAKRGGSLEKRQDVAGWFWLPVWKESAPKVAAVGAANAKAAPWLLLQDKAGLGAKLATRLRQQGHALVEVIQGREFRRTGADAYELNPGRREDYASLLSELAADGRLPERIVHLTGITAEGSGAATEDVVERSFFSPLHLAQALGAHTTGKPVRLTLVSNGMQEVTGGDLVSPEQAVALGPTNVIPRELPHVHCRSVDVTLPPLSSFQAGRLVELLAAELASDSEEPVVAFRSGRRWVRDFEEVRLEEGPESAVPLREGGVYLITGGLGGIGLSFAEALAEKCHARLVLVGRAVVPPREEWAKHLEASGGDEATRRRIQAVQRLEEKGAKVLALSADVTDLERMRAVVATARERFGAIHGVIHAAGVPGGGLLQLKTREAATAVLAPKVTGTRVLGAVLEGERLDFFAACSSLTTVVGRFGQVDYTAANAYLDAFTRAYQARTGTYAVSINWGAWDEVGMAARPATQTGEGRAIPHPFVHRCLVDTPQRKVFSGTFGEPRSQWVTDEHRILGNPTVPGVTYFEMVRAAVADEAKGRTIELLDNYFLAPLRVPENETREVRLTLEKDGDGYRWGVKSLPPGGVGKGTDHSAGRVRFGGPRVARVEDLEAIRKRCDKPRPQSLEAEYEQELGPRWRSVQAILPGDNELLMVLELMPEFTGDFEQLLFHPSLIDRTSGIAKSFLAEHGYYLPFGYKVLRLHGELPRRVYSHARFRANESSNGDETLAFDLTMMDEQGRVLVEVERLTQKRVNDPAAELRALAAAARESALAKVLPTEERQEISPREGVVALERILASALASQVVVSVRDLHATIAHTDEVVRERVLQAVGETRAPGEQQARPKLKTEYVAPRNDIEQRIAEAWQAVLGIDRVGVNDNFFELGGDSVQAIQIIARGSQSGLQLSPQQFFQYSTIAELAAMIAGIVAKQAEQGPVVGPAPLTPEQRRLLEAPTGASTRVARVAVRGPVDAPALSQALGTVLSHHDALRLRFTRGVSGWQQAGTAPGTEVSFAEVDLRALPAAEHEAALHGEEEKLRAKLDVGAGPLAAAAWVRLEGGVGSQLLIAAHGLAVDGASWRLLVEDLSAAVRQTRGGPALRAKTASFKRWAERLTEEATSESLRKEESVWTGAAQDGATKLPVERAGSPSGAARVVEVSLSEDETRRLHEKLSGTWRADVAEGALAALGQALATWTGGGRLRVDVVTDGRDAFDGQDFSRTVGCFDVTWPLLLELERDQGAGDALKAAKERMRRVPRRGIGFGLLRDGSHGELSERLRHLPRAEVLVRHLGSVDATEDAAPFGAGTSPGAHRATGGYALEVETFLSGGRLHVRCAYDDGTYTQGTASKLAGDVLAALRTLGSEAQDTKAALSSVDFPLAGLDDSQLGALAALINDADGSES
ncbi:SDR family NAD(P)-dependent oxidoreductase [Corallococcus sp. CA047B]|uniref:type I polyketide synthase n=1 Tax=Corallococcus sp. CA047B TaxID=2316729 RepID=UPI000EA094C3|nr:type I polyketide synthase [Corallococcus sp. CA047B]RKH15658.1 SDR family NAD(P)-dependent oxidoreductase [Corallococcus sp. CA047B]